MQESRLCFSLLNLATHTRKAVLRLCWVKHGDKRKAGQREDAWAARSAHTDTTRQGARRCQLYFHTGTGKSWTARACGSAKGEESSRHDPTHTEKARHGDASSESPSYANGEEKEEKANRWQKSGGGGVGMVKRCRSSGCDVWFFFFNKKLLYSSFN